MSPRIAALTVEDSCGGGHVQSRRGRHPPAGVRAQSRWPGGGDHAAGDRRRHPS